MMLFSVRARKAIPLLLCTAWLLAGCSGGRTAAPEVEAVNGVRAAVVADATIYRDYPDRNFGTRKELAVETERDTIKHFLMRFSIEGVGDRDVVSAKLLLFCSNESDFGGSFQVTDPAWTESEVTWNNAPPQGRVLGTLDEVDEGATYAIDLTSLIKGDGSYDLRVSSLSTEKAGFLSRENSTNAPRLEIEVAGR